MPESFPDLAGEATLPPPHSITISFNQTRPHQGLEQRIPDPSARSAAPLGQPNQIIAVPVLGDYIITTNERHNPWKALAGTTHKIYRRHEIRLCYKNSHSKDYNERGRSLFLLSLGRHSKQAGDKDDLILDVSLLHTVYLPLAKHVHHLVALQGSPRCLKGKEAHPWLDQTFDKPVVLLDEVIEIFDLPQLDRDGKRSAGFEFCHS